MVCGDQEYLLHDVFDFVRPCEQTTRKPTHEARVLCIELAQSFSRPFGAEQVGLIVFRGDAVGCERAGPQCRFPYSIPPGFETGSKRSKSTKVRWCASFSCEGR